MSTPDGHQEFPEENEVVSVAQLKKVMAFIEEKFNNALAELERRNDETLAARLRDETIARENQFAQVVDAINKLSDGMRVLAQQKGSSKSDLFAEIAELVKPIVQKKMLGEPMEDELTSQVNQLGMLTVRGTLKELLNAQKLQVRRMMKKGDLSLQDVQQSNVADLVLDKALDNHARI